MTSSVKNIAIGSRWKSSALELGESSDNRGWQVYKAVCTAKGAHGEKAQSSRVGTGRRVTVLVEVFGDVTADSYAAEAGAVRHAGLERRREHATVRACARSALARLGQRPTPILNDADGVPIWPAGVVGSLTHCRGYRAALVALGTDVASVGVDAEPHEALSPGGGWRRARTRRHDRPARRLASPAGSRSARRRRRTRHGFRGPGEWLEFTDVVTHVRADGTFTACVGGLPPLRGRWAVRRGYVVAAGLIPC